MASDEWLELSVEAEPEAVEALSAAFAGAEKLRVSTMAAKLGK